MLMVLIALIALGMMSLAAIELRRSALDGDMANARANARLALIQAIGQLQRTLGPDQRVSATAEILPGDAAQPHWTGAWRSTADDGTSFFTRDDLDGGLRDSRADSGTHFSTRAIEWLVSGDAAEPSSDPKGDTVVLGRDEMDRKIKVPKVAMRRADGKLAGHHAWWTGDLGVRANLSTRDAWKHAAAASGGGFPGVRYRDMISQAADPSMMDGGKSPSDSEILRLASQHTSGLTSAGADWAEDHAFNITADSAGVLADPLGGGLKSDLTAFITGSGAIADDGNLRGLTEIAPLIGHGEEGSGNSRTALMSPTFGLLRDWARLNAPEHGKNVASRLPETDRSAGSSSEAYHLANESPVKLAGNTRASLQPILVEATNYIHLSTFRLSQANPPKFQLRHHLYPRVVLWNPHNVELDFDRSIIMIQGNGRQEMWTENVHFYADGRTQPFGSVGQWLSFEGGRSTSFNASGKGIMGTDGYNDPYIGSYYFSIPRTRFAPGECLVFSPARQAEYDCLSPYRQGFYNLNSNELSCSIAPDPSRSYCVSGTDIGGGIPYQPVRFWYAPTPYWSQTGRNGVENQGDDTRAVLKHVGSSSSVITFEDFDRLPQISVVSASLQYGAGREPRIAWADTVRMPMELLDRALPRPTVIPNVRTREGVRLRWFTEHESNRLNSGRLQDTPFMEEALLGNWNLRAAFGVRSPWENIGGELPKSGTAGGPWFFGAYTRDLFDDEVSWQQQVPVMSGGRTRGNPFGPPQEGAERHVLFEVPRSGTGVISLGQFQHAKLSDLVWHPSYAIGNSLPDPRLGGGGYKGLNRTAASSPDSASSSLGGFHRNQIGWSSDNERSRNQDEWAATVRAMLGHLPQTDNLVVDLSFEANHALWDRFFLSSGTPSEKLSFIDDPHANPLPNGRMRLAPGGDIRTLATDLASYHRAASRLMVDGAFNVNSTRVEAWKALLASGRLSDFADGVNVPFSRFTNAPGGVWKTGSPPDGDEMWAGRRELSPGEIERLAEAIVDEVKLRGPFISLSDFINRRLAEDITGRMGALQAAIERAGLNSPLAHAWPLDNHSSLPDYAHPDNIADSTAMEQTLKPPSKVWGAPAWLTQADVLQSLGPALAARSDTFVIRAYGETVDPSGKTTAIAWCEAVVQRTPEPLAPDQSGINPRDPGTPGDFGRRFSISSFRWIHPREI